MNDKQIAENRLAMARANLARVARVLSRYGKSDSRMAELDRAKKSVHIAKVLVDSFGESVE